MNPKNCATCHAEHFKQWSGSMHAYASDDPVFLAMNARAQRETKGGVGSFCVGCHAPLAVRTGATTDGLNLASLPASLKGVTCFFCHTADKVDGLHNDMIHLAGDDTLRAAIPDPAPNAVHRMGFSTLHDGERLDSSQLCGSCHDVQNQNGVDLERTYAEWKGSLFAHDTPGVKLSCSSCHMPGADGTAATIAGAPKRRVHDHTMAGVDVALTAFPEADTQRRLIQASLDQALVAKLCVKAGGAVDASLEAAFVGHAWPSGASHDRSAWVELIAYAGGQMVFQSGVVPDGKAVRQVTDPNLWLLREKLFDAQKMPVSFLWQAASSDPAQLPVAVTGDTKDPMFQRAVTRTFTVPANADRVTMRVQMRPMDFDTIDELVQSGDLDAALRGKLSTFTLASTVLEWKTANGIGCVP